MMNSLMQNALGADWEKLPAALQAHYRAGSSTDVGHLDIEYPRFMQPVLFALHRLGALVHRRGRGVRTVVEKGPAGQTQRWQRTMTYADGRQLRFDTRWIAAGGNQLIEFVNAVFGLQMAVHVEDGCLHYRGVRFVARLGGRMIPIPEWLLLGHTTIVEHAIDDGRFAMDFRLTHPLFGQIFRYAGVFEAR